MLLRIVAILPFKLVEARITHGLVSKVRTGASVVVEGLELVSDRFIENQVHVGIVSIPEFQYDDIICIAGIVAIIPISVVSSTALATGEGRVSDEGWKGGEGGGFKVVHHFS